ncbi:hypothetical protein D4764_13G0000400 [Takifugu flavidus]|uniref:Secreted protein n=1 Tax=Takifugu flavidus TaxID=433684 RepID=A0A5C6P9J3_9TELE|nr:hypothetical protein D4764_13G0000400 [Takifugu flavidus]
MKPAFVITVTLSSSHLLLICSVRPSIGGSINHTTIHPSLIHPSSICLSSIYPPNHPAAHNPSIH